MVVGEHEGVDASEVVGVHVEKPSHDPPGRLAAAVMFDGVLSRSAASKKAVVVAVCALLPTSSGVPSVPDSAEGGCSNAWGGVGGQELKHL